VGTRLGYGLDNMRLRRHPEPVRCHPERSEGSFSFRNAGILRPDPIGNQNDSLRTAPIARRYGGNTNKDGKNKLYFGDNLKILREYVEDASVDLIYLDPPFNSSPSAPARGGEPFSFAQGRELVERRVSNRATYNVLFKKDVAQGPLPGPAAFPVFPAAQITAFEDTYRLAGILDWRATHSPI
jgi:hypothetical protein